ncbi:TPA: conjugal transfer protein TraX [Escherichia coli]|uniref:conjugal transfer protein TraX n=1 Tax=Escherichia coli TaxID=562 RepID=UPI000BE43789|nr:conjugal transfer protein TraX [Escherichia coli]EIY9855690.1 conjugal transfer protein TraX [Escherichia coli]MBB8052107.1 conjugal transfer protein TraX [Escherichia coli]MEC9712629.1 conjugal transfer protein TraX [Escherichia coli]MED8707833.1 conjugal transfer protein TraX [Escherichia coli]MED8731656.1 conjugal transfer protein TraX [Escherichia coli]
MKGNRLKKTAWYTANIFIPLSETRLTMNTIIPSWKKQFQRIRVARKLMGRRQRNQTAYTWAEAVALTRMTPAQLEQRFLRRKRLYLVLSALPALLATGLLLALLISGIYTPMAFMRIVIMVLILLGLASIPGLQVVICSWRLWQLREQRVSVEEQGTFRDFTHGRPWIRESLLSWH